MSVNPIFAKWATEFSGCDGGNPNGEIWICGLEMAGVNDLEFHELSEPPYIGHPHRDRAEFFNNSKGETQPYNVNAVKLLSALEGREVNEYKSFFEEYSCFDKKSNYFKLNLFPIQFKNTDPKNWLDHQAKITGFSGKKEYKKWCEEHRFPVLKGWVTRFSPKLIICTGTTYDSEFKSAFGSGNTEYLETEAAGKKIKYFVTNNNRTLVAVTYFLVHSTGLNSHEKLALTGKKLSELMGTLLPV